MTYTLITGASSGIGEALSRRLGTSRTLILHGRAQDRLEAVRGDAKHLVWPYDLRDVANAADALAAFLGEHDANVDTFVHCAGVVRVLPMRDMDAETVSEMMNVNVLSAVQLVRALLRRKVNGGKLARVLFLSSIYSIRGAKGHAIYSATKGAIDAMVRSLAAELAPGVRVNSIVAGGVPTPMSAAVFSSPELRAKSEEEHLLRLGEVADLVNAAEFLLSDRAEWVTGTGLVVDGGMSVR